MGLFDFVKDAGERLFGRGGDKKELEQEQAVRTMEDALADKARGEQLTKMVTDMGFVDYGSVAFREGLATITGTAPSQADKEKAVLLVGNTQGVGQVDDQIEVAAPPPARMYTVQSGDSLSKIAKEMYGDAMKYPAIFDANRPLLSHPDKIYPGQVLRIPNLEG